ncbi:MAG: hypothetical protein A2V83_02060 [Nitrospirae bacterium RBG_16_64_22]|nr:MAG: hypothetical protein A2V83_02060 [Nitrospirae bacterium RBG_16_64_22]
MMRPGRKSLPLQTILFLALAGTPPLGRGQGAQGDVEIRERWAKAVAATRTEACAEESEPIRKSIDYAAMLIVHGEIAEAKDVLAGAARKARSPACGETLRRLSIPPS